MAIESDPHRSRFALVILVAASTRSSKKSCMKLITNNTIRRLVVGSRATAAQHASASPANAMQSLYIAYGIRGSMGSRSQSLNNDAGTSESTLSSVYEPRSNRICEDAVGEKREYDWHPLRVIGRNFVTHASPNSAPFSSPPYVLGFAQHLLPVPLLNTGCRAASYHHRDIAVEASSVGLNHLVIGPGHGIRTGVRPEDENEDLWLFASYQRGRGHPSIFRAHIPRSSQIASLEDPKALLVFSGYGSRSSRCRRAARNLTLIVDAEVPLLLSATSECKLYLLFARAIGLLPPRDRLLATTTKDWALDFFKTCCFPSLASVSSRLECPRDGTRIFLGAPPWVKE
ncbi:hypothetical protein EDB83DRAFT_2648650 [Lactarius deliciosus]|nr:hypothetical protein EDB83DRAFT_2648650 [Lactarius deliciosus]